MCVLCVVCEVCVVSVWCVCDMSEVCEVCVVCVYSVLCGVWGVYGVGVVCVCGVYVRGVWFMCAVCGMYVWPTGGPYFFPQFANSCKVTVWLEQMPLEKLVFYSDSDLISESLLGKSLFLIIPCELDSPAACDCRQ